MKFIPLVRSITLILPILFSPVAQAAYHLTEIDLANKSYGCRDQKLGIRDGAIVEFAYDVEFAYENNETLEVRPFITASDLSKLRMRLIDIDLVNDWRPTSLCCDTRFAEVVFDCLRNPNGRGFKEPSATADLSQRILFAAIQGSIVSIVRAFVKAGIYLHDPTRRCLLTLARSIECPEIVMLIEDAMKNTPAYTPENFSWITTIVPTKVEDATRP